jgi:glutathione S-transferase
MTAPFRLYGAELSPFSLKVRSYLRFKDLAFDWLPRSNARQEEFTRYAKLPLMPVLVDADEAVLQDSTPTIEALERAHAEPSITPDDPALAFLSALIEDYADEWLNKAMFHYRWSYADDAQSAARRTVEMLYEGAEAPDGVEEAVRARMVGRLHHVGSTPDAAPLIEGSFIRLLDLLEKHFAKRAYLFGGRPSLADFGLAAQLAQLLSDPTPGALINSKAPRVAAWVARMDNPKVEGKFEKFEALRESLSTLLELEFAGAYLIWAVANAYAVSDDAPNVSVDIDGHAFIQRPQRYAAKAFSELRRKRAEAAEHEGLTTLLGETGCDRFFEPPAGGEPQRDNESENGSDGEDDAEE